MNWEKPECYVYDRARSDSVWTQPSQRFLWGITPTADGASFAEEALSPQVKRAEEATREDVSTALKYAFVRKVQTIACP
jgi:hypothetical protein